MIPAAEMPSSRPLQVAYKRQQLVNPASQNIPIISTFNEFNDLEEASKNDAIDSVILSQSTPVSARYPLYYFLRKYR
jgi:hypothetical protein